MYYLLFIFRIKITRFVFSLFGGREEFLKWCFTDWEKQTIKMALDKEEKHYYTKLDREPYPFINDNGVNLREIFSSELWK